MVDSNPNSSQSARTRPLSGASASGAKGAGPSASSADVAGSLDGVTQKLPPVDGDAASASSAAPSEKVSHAINTGPTRVLGNAGNSVSGRVGRSDSGAISAGTKSGSVSRDVSEEGSASQDTVASRRAAHGLAPEATSKADAAELRRQEKEASAEERKRKFKKQQRAKTIRRSIIAVVILLVVGVLLGFWLLRWGLHDDAASIQGQWRVQGTDTVIDITDEKIVLTDEVAYDYVIDPEAKTLTFTFGGLTGNGRYRFSLDHSQLAIDDGEFDWGGTLMADIPWTLEAVAQKLVGNPEKSPSLGPGEMVLEKIG